MPMTVVVTRNVPMRFRGFLASTMLEVSPGVYTNPKLSRGVGQRIWNVLSEWFDHTGQDASIVMLWGSVQTLQQKERPWHVVVVQNKPHLKGGTRHGQEQS